MNRKAAKYAKLKTRSKGIVQNRDTVLDKAAFSFAVARQMKKNFLHSFATFACLVKQTKSQRSVFHWAS